MADDATPAVSLTDFQRLWDLVRHQRGELFDAELITAEEYATLATDPAAVGRLHSYDNMRVENVRLSAELEKWRRPPDDAKLDEIRIQYRRGRSHAAAAALINGLEHALAHARRGHT